MTDKKPFQKQPPAPQKPSPGKNGSVLIPNHRQPTQKPVIVQDGAIYRLDEMAPKPPVKK